jgi:antitoxin YefM
MKTVPLSAAKAKLSSLVDCVEGHDEEVVITRNGRAAAVLMSPTDFEGWKETATVRADADLVAEIRRGQGR